MHLKMSLAKSRPFSLGLNMLIKTYETCTNALWFRLFGCAGSVLCCLGNSGHIILNSISIVSDDLYSVDVSKISLTQSVFDTTKSHTQSLGKKINERHGLTFVFINVFGFVTEWWLVLSQRSWSYTKLFMVIRILHRNETPKRGLSFATSISLSCETDIPHHMIHAWDVSEIKLTADRGSERQYSDSYKGSVT